MLFCKKQKRLYCLAKDFFSITEKSRLYEHENISYFNYCLSARQKMFPTSLKNPLSMYVCWRFRVSCVSCILDNVIKSSLYAHTLNWDLRWAQRNFPPSADKCENSFFVTNSVLVKHSSEAKIYKKNWVEGYKYFKSWCVLSLLYFLTSLMSEFLKVFFGCSPTLKSNLQVADLSKSILQKVDLNKYIHIQYIHYSNFWSRFGEREREFYFCIQKDKLNVK